MWFRTLFDSLKPVSPRRRSSKARRCRPAARVRPHLEVLEDRTVPSTYSVITAADNGDDFNPVAGSLRAAIAGANAHANGLNADGFPVLDRIVFAIPGDGAHTIQPLSALPDITDPVILDATTQPGYAGTPLIELDGSLATDANGLVLTAGQTSVRGFAINRFGSGTGILADGPGGNVIQGNYLGTDLAGNAVFPARLQTYGVALSDTSGNVIGTDGDGVNDNAEGNVISGQDTGGVLLYNGAANNVIAGNRIGTNAAGDAALGNGRMGVFFIAAGTGNRIGTNADGVSDAAEANLISGNPEAGIFIDSDSNVVAGNRIGTNVTGTAALPNGAGVELSDASHNTIGGTLAGAGNLIADNTGDGVAIFGASTDNHILGNTIFGNGGYDTDLATSGTANVAGAGSGSFFVAAGGTFNFAGYDFAAGSSISGAGIARFAPQEPVRILGDMTLDGVTLENAGLIQINTVNSLSIFMTGGATLHNMPGATISTQGPLQSLIKIISDAAIKDSIDAAFQNAGTIQDIAGNFEIQAAYSNFNGSVICVGVGATLDFLKGATFGPGTRFCGGGLVQQKSSNPFTILGNMTLDGVTLENAGSLVFSNGSPIDILLQGGATLHNLSSGTIAAAQGSPIRAAITGDGTFVNDGLVNVQQGTFQVGAGSSTGKFQVAAGAALQFVDGYTLGAGTSITGLGSTIIGGPIVGSPIGLPIEPAPVEVAADLSIPNLTIGSGGLLSVQAFLTLGSTLVIQSAGTLRGTRAVIGNVVSSGFVRPGLSPGTLTINGDYTQTAEGVLEMEIGGSAAGQFDRLIVTGTANLGGTLDVRLVNGFTPQAADSFPILQYGSRTGNFAQAVGDFSTTQLGPTGVTIKVQSGSTGKATGEGRLDRDRSFHFDVQGKLKHNLLAFDGKLEYRDRSSGIRLESTSITAFHIDGDGRHASFSGTAKLNGKQGYTFVVDIVDGADGHGQFRIRIYQDASLIYDSALFGSAVLEHGQIKVRR